jgi:LmbE family N-acetylglucosaminyl deacetylase
MSGRLPVEQVGTLLGIWAHPDDEAYLSAGLMAMTRRNDQRVVVVTATFGERGTDDPHRWPPTRLAQHRRQEMAASLAALGVHEHHWLGYPDGGCQDVPDSIAIDAIGRIIDGIQPDTIVTFGPDGMTGHHAHMSVSRWATDSFAEVAPPGARLHYATMTPAYVEEFREIFEPLGIFRPGTPPVTPPEQLSIDLSLDDDALDRKFRAISEHESQIGYIVEAVGAEVFRREMANEWFRLAAEKG